MARELRRFSFAALTALGIKPLGFFIPYRHADGIAPPGTRPPYATIADLFAAQSEVFRATLARLEDFTADLGRIGADPPPAPRWAQDWFPRLDSAILYGMVRAACPRRIVEVGAGHSTRFIARALADGKLDALVTVIDPGPRARLAGLAVEHIARDVLLVDDAPFAALAAGDILVIDSSHVLMPGTDVDRLFNRVMPALPSGVLVHVHDVFLPDDYPPDWAWRGYNEQLAVAALLAGGAWQPLFASHYVASRHPDWLAAGIVGRLPLAPGARETSLWLRKR
ncbi:MAG: class I SAM-dependent methyltransferase [Alphaproteobacteria bacterium]|nr:class I SAM-dependent methyltransferase [Alphaproteobacteria bacterium]